VILIEASRQAPLQDARHAVDEAVNGSPGVSHVCPPALYRLEYQKLKLAV
jgi:hypothetical protein